MIYNYGRQFETFHIGNTKRLPRFMGQPLRLVKVFVGFY